MENVIGLDNPVPLETKLEICDEIMSSEKTTSEVCATYGFSNRLRNWVWRVKCGVTLRKREGRPCVVDDDLLEELRNIIYPQKDICDDEMRALVRRQYDLSKKRKLGEGYEDNDEIKYSLKRHTMYRVINKLRQQINLIDDCTRGEEDV